MKAVRSQGRRFNKQRSRLQDSHKTRRKRRPGTVKLTKGAKKKGVKRAVSRARDDYHEIKRLLEASEKAEATRLIANLRDRTIGTLQRTLSELFDRSIHLPDSTQSCNILLSDLNRFVI